SNDPRSSAPWVNKATITDWSCEVAGRVEGGMTGLRGEEADCANAWKGYDASPAAASTCRRVIPAFGEVIMRNSNQLEGWRHREPAPGLLAVAILVKNAVAVLVSASRPTRT